MRPLHIIMPMAGEGSRFKEAGYTVPKPLIKVEGMELYRHALSSINTAYFKFNTYDKFEIKYTFIVRKEFIDDYHIDEEIKKNYPDANIVYVEKTTRGALETIMLAEKYIDDNDYVISLDCDIKFKCTEYNNKIFDKCVLNSVDPMVLSFYSRNPIYSFIKPSENNSKYGEFVAEKDPISTYALGGCYCLGSGDRFKKAAKKYITDFDEGKIISKELYLSLVLNYIVNIYQTNIRIIDMDLHKDHYWSFGTPYDLEHYNYNRSIWDE